MAGLVDKVNSALVRKDGKLVQQATPTSQLAGQAGMVAPPTTPAGVAALGGTPQQQAMAGSAAQKQSALRQSLDTSTTLQEAQQDKRYRSALTADESAQVEKQKRLGEVFGSTQSKVQSLIDNEINKASAQQATPALATSGYLKATTGGTAENQGQVDTAFQYMTSLLASGIPPTDPRVIEQLNHLSVLTNKPIDEITASASAAMQQQLNTQAGTAAAQNVVDGSTINVSTLLPDLGTDRTELAILLGLDPTVIDSMSLSDLDAAIKATVTQGPGMSVGETQAASQSGLLGAAERSALREASKEQSTTGQAASEAQLLDLGRSLENADTISFGGKQYTVEEFLKDENISQLVSDYLTAAPGSDIRKRLEADPNAAGLLGFVNKYKDTLTEAVQQIGTAVTEQKSIQESNRQLSSPVPGIVLPDSLMRSIYGSDWGKLQSGKLADKGLVAALKALGPEGVSSIAAPLQEMIVRADGDSVLASMVNTLAPKELVTFLTPRANGKSPFTQMQETRAMQARIDAARSTGNNADILAMYFDAPTAPGMDKAYTDQQFATMANEIRTALAQIDTPAEVISGGSGWTPVSLSDRLKPKKMPVSAPKPTAVEKEAKQLGTSTAVLSDLREKLGMK